MIVDKSGDLLRDDAQALVNPVNTVGVMGAGLALAFKTAFPANFAAYAQACAAGDVVVGRVFATRVDESRWIVNVPTKRHWRARSRFDDVRAGLTDLAAFLTREKVTSVAVPALGCGLGGLAWEVVRPLISAELADVDAEIRLYGPQQAVPSGARQRRRRGA